MSETPGPIMRPPATRTVKAGVVRDDAWINQKRHTGMRRLLLKQTECCVRFGEDLLVGDLEIASAAIRGTFGVKKSRGAWVLRHTVSLQPGTAIHEALLKEIDPVPSFTIVYKDFGAGIAARDLKFTLADIDTF